MVGSGVYSHWFCAHGLGFICSACLLPCSGAEWPERSSAMQCSALGFMCWWKSQGSVHVALSMTVRLFKYG